MTKTIDADAVIDADYTPTREEQHDKAVLALMRRDAGVPEIPTYFAPMRPAERIAYATEMANALKQIIDAKGLGHRLNSKNPDDEYVELEAWQTCGSLCGMAAKIEWTRPIEKPHGYEARAVIIRTDTGLEIGSGESMCNKSEKRWSYAEDYALRGMAQTRAQSRAFRGQLAWILVLAGYKPTPAEEMPDFDKPATVVAADAEKPADTTTTTTTTTKTSTRKAKVAEPAPAVPKVATDSAKSAADKARNAWVGKLTALEDRLDLLDLPVVVRTAALRGYGVKTKRELTQAQMTDYGAWLNSLIALDQAERKLQMSATLRTEVLGQRYSVGEHWELTPAQRDDYRRWLSEQQREVDEYYARIGTPD